MVLSPLPAFSAQSDFEEIAENLIGPVNLATLIIDQQTYCLQLVEADFLPQKMYEYDPNMFEGITPETPEWAELNKAYEAFVNDVCGHMKYEKYRNFILKTYADAFTSIGITVMDQVTSEDLGKAGEIVRKEMVKKTDESVTVGLKNYEDKIIKTMKSFKGKIALTN